VSATELLQHWKEDKICIDIELEGVG